MASASQAADEYMLEDAAAMAGVCVVLVDVCVVVGWIMAFGRAADECVWEDVVTMAGLCV